jgi:hypothetical protein
MRDSAIDPLYRCRLRSSMASLLLAPLAWWLRVATDK